MNVTFMNPPIIASDPGGEEHQLGLGAGNPSSIHRCVRRRTVGNNAAAERLGVDSRARLVADRNAGKLVGLI